MQHDDKAKAIQFIRPNAEFVLRGDELEWLDANQTQPTEQEIADGFIAYQAKLESDQIDAENKKMIAENKLAALGLTADDLKALGF